MLGVQLHRTTAYHPQSNGLVERFHRTMKTSLKARLTGPNWIYEFPWFLLRIRTTPKQDNTPRLLNSCMVSDLMSMGALSRLALSYGHLWSNSDN